jgi:hypothetical protein
MHNGVVVKSTTTNVGINRLVRELKEKLTSRGKQSMLQDIRKLCYVVVNTNSFAGGKR